MSSSRSSSSSPEPELVSKKAKKAKNKQKKVKLAREVHEDARNEGTDPNWDYKPPEGCVLMKHKTDEGDFDWDAINNDDNLELWVVRVPEGLKPKYLEDMKLELPSSSKTMRVGVLDRKHTAYDVWALGEDEAEAVGGDELRTMSCLLPRQKKEGKLFQAPHPVARRLVISARPVLPTPQSSPESSPTVHENPPRPRYPKEFLKHRFMPLGSLAPIESSGDMDVSTTDAPATASKPSQPHKSAEGAADGKKKKRKGDTESPKKIKKAKTAS